MSISVIYFSFEIQLMYSIMLKCLAKVTFFVILVITLERPHSLGGGVSPLYEENVAEE